MLTRLRDNEDGVAMIVALAVAFVVLLLSTVVVTQSIHSLESSGRDRQRLLSVNAAEAGTNHWYSYLERSSPEDIAADPGCDSGSGALTIGEAIGSGPTGAAFESVGTFYAADGTTPMSCATASATNVPFFVSIESTGTAGGAERTIETYIRLSLQAGGGYGAAILANSVALGNSVEIYGDVGNDADIYVLTGNVSVGNSAKIFGSLFVPGGTATLRNSARVEGDVWANGTVTMENSSGWIGGDATSSTGNITGGSSTQISGNAKAAGTISGVSVGGTTTPSTPSGPPPSQTFPQITWDPTDWTDVGYTINTYSGATACPDARNFLTGSWSGDQVVRITGPTPCTLMLTNSTEVTVNGNVAVVTDWGIEFVNSVKFKRGSSPVKNAYFISVWDTTCPASGASHNTITASNSTEFEQNVTPIFYSPCQVNMNNSTSFAGQVIAGAVSVINSFKMTYAEVLIPGAPYDDSGFSQDIAYVREI